MASISGVRLAFRGLLPAALALALGAALAGCAGLAAPGSPGAAVAPGQGAAAAADQAPASAGGSVAPLRVGPLPDVELNSDLLFQLVFAEIALQRGEPGPAYAELMKVAAQTLDPRIARRATEVAITARALPQALEAAALWHKLAPSDREAEQSYAQLLVANGRHDRRCRCWIGRSRSRPIRRKCSIDLQRVLAQLRRRPGVTSCWRRSRGAT